MKSSPSLLPGYFAGSAVARAPIALAMTVFLVFLTSLAPAVEINWDDVTEYTPFSTMQAVNPDGTPAWTVPQLPYDPYSQAYKLRGVVLNNPSDMLDSTANYLEGQPGNMGGQWQVFIQAVALPGNETANPELVGDFGGTALWMGQNYGNHPMRAGDYSYNYANSEWEAEMQRLNYPVDAQTGLAVIESLRKGDLIEVRARAALHYAGKFNCNEHHNNDPDFDFEILILDRDLPVTPAAITLDDVMDSSGEFLFDQTRETGAEYYQAQYVTLEGVTIADASDWYAYGEVLVTDGSREFKVRLGDNGAFDTAALPEGQLSVTGIFDHAAPIYQMWATSPSEFAPAAPLIPGDANGDGVVDQQDAIRLAGGWGKTAHVSWFDGDFNRDGRIDAIDAAILAAHWGQSLPEATATTVPEPSGILLILSGIAALAMMKRNGR